MKTAIRADANEIIATGHVMRCLSIAKEIEALGGEVVFVVADDRPWDLIESRGFKTEVLNTTWNDMTSELTAFEEYIKSHKIDMVMVDSYYATLDYLKILSSITKVAYIDDFAKDVLPVDILIHYSPFADSVSIKRLYKDTETKLLIGGDYIPLRSEFRNVDRTIKDIVKDVLITTGGTDQLRIAEGLLEHIVADDSFSDIRFHVIAGAFNKSLGRLEEIAVQYDNVSVYKNVKEMSTFMDSCDIAISAGGSTLFELCACGVPTVCLEVADNQRGASIWEERGYMLYAGNATDDREGCINSCIQKLKCFMTDHQLRVECSKKVQHLVDGKGAERIAIGLT